jgi:hypothetical protein
MGWFESEEETRKKDLAKRLEKQMKDKIANEGLGNIIAPEDYQKVLIEQNDTIISLLSVIAIGQSGIVGDAVTVVHTNKYYEALNRIINK